jgi:hypothetical protein
MKASIAVAGAVALTLLTPLAAHAQLFSEDFEAGAGAWTLDPGVGGCSWAADGTPALSFAFLSCGGLGDPTAKSPVPGGVNALNWNNGTDMDYGGTLTAGNIALGPVITVTSLAGLTLTFDDFYECDSCAIPNNHQRFVEITDSAGTVVLKSVQLTYSDGPTSEASCPPLPFVAGAAGNLNDHHSHTIDLSTIGSLTFRIRFRFTTVGYTGAGLEDTLVGWFVDNVNVFCPDAIAPTAPTLISPPDMAVVVSPVTLDWSDSTDTTSCGAGTIQNYDVQTAADAAFTIGLVTTVVVPSTSTQVLLPGTYFWRVRARDQAGIVSPFSASQQFTVEAPLPPLPPDTLQVNESSLGAQSGVGGFVDPVLDQTPAFSAIFRDGNTTDTATQYRMRIATDAAFSVVVFDSGLLPELPPLAKDARCPDKSIPISLLKDTTYFWQILFVDAGGMVGPFSTAQSFRVGDDFEFGVRPGSSNHSRRCWVATAAWGTSDAQSVVDLQAWRSTVGETSPAGLAASRTYHVAGPLMVGVIDQAGGRGIVRTGTSAAVPAFAVFPVVALAVLVAGLLRLPRKA